MRNPGAGALSEGTSGSAASEPEDEDVFDLEGGIGMTRE
jgi:hypothetical protein